MGTPLCIPSKEFIDIGKIASIEINHKQVDTATKGQKVAIKVCKLVQSSAALTIKLAILSSV